MCSFLGTILPCPPGASCSPRYFRWRDKKAFILSKAMGTFYPSCPKLQRTFSFAQCPQLYCPSQVQKCSSFCNILCYSAPGQGWFWYKNCSHLPCWDIFGYLVIFEKKTQFKMGAGGKLCALAEAHSKWAGSA